jgi:hypothetical protein
MHVISGSAGTEELQRAVLVTKSVIIVSAAVVVAALARRLAFAAIEFLQRLVIIQRALALWRSMQQAGESYIVDARGAFAQASTGPKNRVQTPETTGRSTSGEVASTTDVLDAVSVALPGIQSDRRDPSRNRDSKRGREGTRQTAGEDISRRGPAGRLAAAFSRGTPPVADAQTRWPFQPPQPSMQSGSSQTHASPVSSSGADDAAGSGAGILWAKQPGPSAGSKAIGSGRNRIARDEGAGATQESGVLWRKRGVSGSESNPSWGKWQVQEQSSSESGPLNREPISAQQPSDRDGGAGKLVASAAHAEQGSQATDRHHRSLVAGMPRASQLPVEKLEDAVLNGGNGGLQQHAPREATQPSSSSVHAPHATLDQADDSAATGKLSLSDDGTEHANGMSASANARAHGKGGTGDASSNMQSAWD